MMMTMTMMIGVRTYKAVALGSAGGFIGDDHGLQDLAVLFKMLLHDLLLRLPGQAPDKDFGQCSIPEMPRRPHCRRHRRQLVENSRFFLVP